MSADLGVDRYVLVAPAGELPPGALRRVRVGRRALVVGNTGDHLFALDDRCSHAAGPLSEGRVDAACLVCPWHGATFDVRTGQPRSGPARKAVRTYPVRVTDGAVWVACS